MSLKERDLLQYIREESISQSLICVICTSPLLNPVVIRECEHVFCKACLSDLRTRQCPCDRKDFDLSKDVAPTSKTIKNLVDELAVSCVNQGCQTVCRRDELLPHLRNSCLLQVVACSSCKSAHVARQDVPKHLKDECEAERLKQAQNRVAQLEPFLDRVCPKWDNVIHINVGGTHHISTTRATLCSAHPNSKLATLFSGARTLPLSTNGEVFLDRNGAAFAELVDWLRNGSVAALSPQAKQEAQFWDVLPPQENNSTLLLRISQLELLMFFSGTKSADGAGTLSLPCTDLSGHYFGGFKLQNSNFRGCNLSGCNFGKATLSGVDFTDCILTGCNFTGAHFRNFTLGDLSGFDLSGCSFTHVNFNTLKISGCKFVRSSFEQADFSGYDLSHLELQGCHFIGISFKAVKVAGCKLVGASFIKANFDDCDLSGADLSGCTFIDVSFKAAKIAGCKLAGASFDKTVMFDLDFSGFDLSGCRFLNVTFRSAKFAECKLVGASFDDRTTLSHCEFSGADVSGATFDVHINLSSVKAEIHKATFNRGCKGGKLIECTVACELDGCKLQKCIIRGNIFITECKFDSCTFDHCTFTGERTWASSSKGCTAIECKAPRTRRDEFRSCYPDLVSGTTFDLN